MPVFFLLKHRALAVDRRCTTASMPRVGQVLEVLVVGAGPFGNYMVLLGT